MLAGLSGGVITQSVFYALSNCPAWANSFAGHYTTLGWGGGRALLLLLGQLVEETCALGAPVPLWLCSTLCPVVSTLQTQNVFLTALGSNSAAALSSPSGAVLFSLEG